MIAAIRQLFRQKQARSAPAIPAGERAYAVGDVHGRLDLFNGMIAAIERDDALRGSADTTIVLLGDLVDRGPDSAGVIAAARRLQQRRKVRIITGNHEEMFLESFYDPELLRHFLRYGGRETILSYPLDPAELDAMDLNELRVMLHKVVPDEDIAFIGSFEDRVEIGDYLFVHAGVRPGSSLELQFPRETRWIREPFLSHTGDHGRVIVHGHTITHRPEVLQNRIGIDTGAYMSGRLTAIGLEGTTRWLIEAREGDGSVETSTRPI